MRRTNMNLIKKEILKDEELWKPLYYSGPRLRHALAHGHKIDLNEKKYQDIDYIDRVYKAIVAYLNATFNLKISTQAQRPQRNRGRDAHC